MARLSKLHSLVQALLFALGGSLTGLLLYWLAPALLEQLDQRSQDFVFTLRAAPPPPEEVAVVAVDEASIKRYGRWPWTRSIQAQLITQLKALGAGTIALDITYPLVENQAADEALAAALAAEGTPVVGGYFFREQQTVAGSERALAQLYENRIKLVLRPPGSHLDTVPTFPFAEPNQADLAAHFTAQGFFNASFDPDGLIRSVPLVLGYQDQLYPSLAAQALGLYGEVPVGVRASIEGLASLRLGQYDVPVDVYGRLALSFYNGDTTIPLLSAADVLDGTIGAEQIEGRLLFVGVTEYGVGDLRPTPVDAAYPGVLLHATAVSNIIQGLYLVRDNRIILINVALMAVVPLLMVLVLIRFRRPAAMAAVFLLIVGGVGLLFYLLVAQGYLVSFVYPTVALALGFASFVSYYVLNTQRQQRFLTEAFSSYVSPALVRQLLADPNRLRLAGEKREITVLFSDIRGFTTISEAMPPEQLAALLNIYLDAMCEIVMDHQGMLDKYIGDAVMALYNAPLDIPDHPARAAESALAMCRRLDELNEEFVKRFGIRLSIGIGLNTGPAIVGNLGGQRRFDYTAIGDTVNLGSRLEGQTKQYRTLIIVSASTQAALGERFCCRRIDLIQVKGKQQAVAIYELMGYADDERLCTLARRFEQVLDAYFAIDFAGALAQCEALLRDYPDDGPTLLLAERCRVFLDSPPLPTWDGVYVATSK